MVLKTDAQFVLKEKGKEGLKKVEKKLEEWGLPLHYEKIKTMDFYPVGMRILSLLGIKEVFNFDQRKIWEMGNFAPRVSFLIKLFIQYFVSVERTFFKECPKIWRKHWSIGELQPIELNLKQKYLVVRIKDFNIHPLYCIYLSGYFSKFTQMLIKTKKVECQEEECFFRQGKHHQFRVKWQ